MAGRAPRATNAAAALWSSARPAAVGNPMASAARSATQRLTGDGSMCARLISQRMLEVRAWGAAGVSGKGASATASL